jgi:hypothetical protein
MNKEKKKERKKEKYIWKFILKFDGGHAWRIFCGASKRPRPCNGIVFVSIIRV